MGYLLSKLDPSLVFLPLTCRVLAGSVSGASASSGELDREMKEGSFRGSEVGVPGTASEPWACSGGMMTDRRGLGKGYKQESPLINKTDILSVKQT